MKLGRMTLLALAFAAFTGCKGGAMQDVQSGAKSEACKQSCATAKTECVDKCAQEADQDACKLACDAAEKKCVEECKDS